MINSRIAALAAALACVSCQSENMSDEDFAVTISCGPSLQKVFEETEPVRIFPTGIGLEARDASQFPVDRSTLRKVVAEFDWDPQVKGRVKLQRGAYLIVLAGKGYLVRKELVVPGDLNVWLDMSDLERN